MLKYAHARNCPFCREVFSITVEKDSAVSLEKAVFEWCDEVAKHMGECFNEKEYAKSVKKN